MVTMTSSADAGPATEIPELAVSALTVRFDALHQAIAPGQLVALYDAHTSEVLASATIREAA